MIDTIGKISYNMSVFLLQKTALMNDLEQILHTLEDMKSVDVTCIHVADMTSIAENMIIVTGNNTRHTRSIMNALLDLAPNLSSSKPRIEGDDHCEWILVHFGDVIVHIMLPHTRSYYALEKLWSKDI